MEYHSGGSLPLLGRPRYCPGASANGGYLCETGHCCGETGCCTYYYELWWFWLLWTVLILFSCCCAYRHRRAKLRVQQQQRQREISLLAYHGASSFPSSMLDLSFLASLKLPSYEEVAAQPSTPPPPYSSVFTTPRYPQPPRAADPHLLTQHDPLLHRPLSDGPSSLSSDNSSSCSCDSCCPSSPCSSSLSAPITYETDTSHASTPSEATPLTLDVTIETIAAAACCLEANKARSAPEGPSTTVAINIEDAEAARAQEPNAKDLSPSSQTVTTAIATRATSPLHLPSPGSELTLPVAATSPINLHLDSALCSPIISAASSSTLPSPSVDAIQVQSIRTMRSESVTRPPADKTLETLSLTRTLDLVSVSCSPASAPPPDVHRTLVFEASSLQNHSFVPITPTQTQEPEYLTPDQKLDTEATYPISPLPDPQNTKDPNSITASIPSPKPLNLNLNQGDKVLVSSSQSQTTPSPGSILVHTTPSPGSILVHTTPSPGSILVHTTPSPGSILVQTTHSPGSDSIQTTHSPGSGPVLSTQSPGSAPVQTTHNPGSGLVQTPHSPGSDPVLTTDSPGSGPVQLLDSVTTIVHCLNLTTSVRDSGPPLVLQEFSETNLVLPLPSEVQAGFSSGSPSGPSPLATLPLVLSCPTPEMSFSCPAITIESDTCLTVSHTTLAVVSPSSPRSPVPLAAPALLLDPLTALQPSDRGGSSPGHVSSHSPSPRATQSPPKQTVFSPCVDIFEPGPSCWEDGDEEQEHRDNDEDEDDDMGADESQYRHRRLTGDSGIEVCRCRVEEEEEDDEEEKEECRKGGESENTDVHDSVDCPARVHLGTGDELSQCTPTTAVTTSTPDDGGKVIVVMETV